MRRLAAKTGEASRAWRAREGVLRRGGDGDDDEDDDDEERVRNSCRNCHNSQGLCLCNFFLMKTKGRKGNGVVCVQGSKK